MMSRMEPADMIAAVATMQKQTGRTLDEWVDLVRHAGLDPLQQNDVRRWLKDVHGVPQNTQWAIADAAARRAGWVEPTPEDHADTMYAGSKASLRPLHDGVVALAVGLGEDCAAEGRSTYTPVVRRTQFAAVAPGPHGTLRVGFRFRTTVPADDRLSEANGFAQSSHWLHLDADSDENDVRSLEPLLQAAYDQNG
jgi:hypothetical protein